MPTCRAVLPADDRLQDLRLADEAASRTRQLAGRAIDDELAYRDFRAVAHDLETQGPIAT